ncbi:MAG: ATP-binding cassette domain-containing protein [bacterium]|nr:ATP-binding cassette domain-containing protein [bacterium]
MPDPHEHHLGEILLRADNVSQALSGTQILRDISVEVKNIIRPNVQQGQVIGIFGRSGVGKTRLFRILAGLDKPTTGSVFINPDNTHPIPVKRGLVGLVAQHYPLFIHRTLLGNLVKAALRTGCSKKEATERSMEMLENFQLSNRANLYPGQLSGGQKQRGAIAQQLLCSKHFLLMDEPFSGLDPPMVNEVIEYIKRVSDTHELNTIILASHYLEPVVEVADTLWLMGKDKEGDTEIPGARIKEIYDLVDMELAWRPNIAFTQKFIDLIREIREKFGTVM